MFVRTCSREAASCHTKCGPVGCHVNAPSKPKAVSRMSEGSKGSMDSQTAGQMRVLPKKSSGLSTTTAALQRARSTWMRCGAGRPRAAARPRVLRTSSESSRKAAVARAVSASRAFSRTSEDSARATRARLSRTWLVTRLPKSLGRLGPRNSLASWLPRSASQFLADEARCTKMARLKTWASSGWFSSRDHSRIFCTSPQHKMPKCNKCPPHSPATGPHPFARTSSSRQRASRKPVQATSRSFRSASFRSTCTGGLAFCSSFSFFFFLPQNKHVCTHASTAGRATTATGLASTP